MEVLVCLARADGRTVTRDELIDACWDGRSVTDDAVGRAIAKVRKIGGLGDAAHFTLETIPKVGFRLLPGVSVPAAMAPLAGNGASIITPNAKPPVIRIAAAAFAAVAAIIMAMIIMVDGGKVTNPSAPRVAVTAFAVAEDGQQSIRMAQNLTEAVLRRMEGFGVADAAQSTGDALHEIDYRVSGMVAAQPNDIVVTAQIFDRKSNVVLWSHKFVQPATEAAGIEERVAISLSAILRCAFEELARNRDDVPPEAFSLILQTCDGLILLTRDALEPARKLHEHYPKIRGANTLMSLAAAVYSRDIEHSPQQRKQLSELAQITVRDALREDPRDAKAWTARAIISDTRIERGRNLRKALEFNPDFAPALGAYVGFLREIGRLREAQELGERVIRMSDPRIYLSMPQVAFLSAMFGDEELGNEAIRKYDEIFPGSAAQIRWTIAIWWMDPAVALKQLPRLQEALQDKSNLECFDHLMPLISIGERSVGLPRSCDRLDWHWRVRLLARLGDTDGAYREFTAIDAQRTLPQILFYPEMRAFRRDSRFIPLIRELGLLDYWRSTGEWPDFCAELDLPYACDAL